MAAKMHPPSRPKARRMTPLLLLCGVVWLVLCWSWVLVTLTASLPHHTNPTSSSSSMPPLPSNLGANGSKQKQNTGRHDLQNVHSDQQTRHLSTSSMQNNDSPRDNIKNDSHNQHQHFLRAANNNKKSLQSPYSQTITEDINQTAPVTPQVYPLHAKSGTHHAYLYIGTPPQRQTLIVDTGSRLTAFPCKPHCPDCGNHASSQFEASSSSSHEVVSCDACQLSQVDFPLEEYFAGDGVGGNSGDGDIPSNSNSLRGMMPNSALTKQQKKRALHPNSCINNQCHIDQRYTEGSSWKAFEVKDKVWLGMDEQSRSEEEHYKYSVPFVFGCQVSEQGLFKSQYADGIMGLSMYTQTLAGVWHEHGSIQQESFSLCLNKKGGHIALGGTGSSYSDAASTSADKQKQHITAATKHLAPMKFTPFAKESVWYYTVTVTSISVGEHKLPKRMLQFVNDNKGTIIDSGTTDTFISHHVAKPFISAWEKITGRKYNNRLQKYTSVQFHQLPIITFELEGGIQWDIKPESYMEAQNNANNETAVHHHGWEGTRGFISRVYVDEPQGVVLGSNAMMDKEIYFDIANRRLGVASATCAY